MQTQFRPISEVIAMLAASAREIADDFFTNHARVDEHAEPTGPAEGRCRTSYTLAAKDDVGRDQQRQLSRILNDIDRLSGSTCFASEFRQRTQDCRLTYSDAAPFRDFAHNHNAAFSQLATDIARIARDMPDKTPGKVFLVPDAKSLLASPELEKWSFPQFDEFTLLLPASLIGELIEIRGNSRGGRDRATCEILIDQLQHYSQRVGMETGISPTNGNVTLGIRPLEPVFDESLWWLNDNSSADRVIAQLVRLIREHPHCVVALVTSDAGLRSRAEESRIDTLEHSSSSGCESPPDSEWP